MNKLKLSLAQQQILDILKMQNKALSAYFILDQAKPLGLNAPIQIYRILKKLTDYGLILKLNSLNLYVAHELKPGQNYPLITICTQCQSVDVIDTPQLGSIMQQALSRKQFNASSHYVELLGQCASCNCKDSSSSFISK
ncbi:Fur family transcriptional regulator [Acinetobacter ihumii]|uniref:Fur family transcriptional regulator n=1 Tax=Acinetobacter ihumii TaxID=2483802 RepID=UPI00102F4493|nr:transcriptional repressor [Acinetobacter ihumii]